jgi:hypothetical protein
MIKRLAFWLYILSFLSHIGLGYWIYNTFLPLTGNTLGLQPLLENFDFQTFSEAIRILDPQWPEFITSVFLFFVINLLLQTFFSGGYMDAIAYEKFSIQRFLIQSKRKFFPFVGLGLILLCFFTVLFILAVISLQIFPKLATHHRSGTLSYALPIVFLGLASAYLRLVWDYSRFLWIQHKNFGKALKGAFKILSSSIPAWGYALSFGLLILCTGLIYLLLTQYLHFPTPILLILQQIHVIALIFIRLLYLQKVAKVAFKQTMTLV